MSAQGHATAADSDASHHDHYLGIPADRPGPDEPRTPLWLPLVGISLLLVALLAFLVTRPAGKTGAELAKEASPEPAAAAAPAASAPTPAAAAPGAANPRLRNLPPHVASAVAEARGAAKKAADEEQGIVAPTGSAPAMRRPTPGAPGAPGARPTVNPPHGMPGHVH